VKNNIFEKRRAFAGRQRGQGGSLPADSQVPLCRNLVSNGLSSMYTYIWLTTCICIYIPGSIPGGVTGFFSDISPSDHTMALGSTQPLVKMSTRNIPGGKGGRCVRLTTSPPSRAECHEIREPKCPGTLWATPSLLRDCFTFMYTYIYTYICVYVCIYMCIYRVGQK
jgi:hypothetical protein